MIRMSTKPFSYLKLSCYSLSMAIVLLFLAEMSMRVIYRVRHGVWPLTLQRVVQQYQADVGALFIEHSILPFVLRPNISTMLMDSKVSINSCGFRGPQLMPATPLRILVVGGSTTFDVSVSNDAATWCAQLQMRLEAVYPGVEVINAGLPIYGIGENFLKYLLYDYQTQPDVLLIYQGLNDMATTTPKELLSIFQEDYWMWRGVMGRKLSGIQGEYTPGVNPVERLNCFAHSVLLMGAYNQRGTNQNIFDNTVKTSGNIENRSAWQQNQYMLASFLTVLQSNGVLPERRKATYSGTGVGRSALKTLNRGYMQTCHAAGVTIIDVTTTLDTWGNAYFQDSVHLNDAGAAELGRLVAEQMAVHPLVQQRYAANRTRTRTLPTTIQVLRKSLSLLESRLDVDTLSLKRLDALTSEGFGALEGPYPDQQLPRKVRWMTQKTAHIQFHYAMTSAIAATLQLKVQTMTMPQQLRIVLNGKEILQYTFAKSNAWQIIRSQKMAVQPGDNRLEFEALNAVRSDNQGEIRKLYLLLEEITIDK